MGSVVYTYRRFFNFDLFLNIITVLAEDNFDLVFLSGTPTTMKTILHEELCEAQKDAKYESLGKHFRKMLYLILFKTL